MTLSLKRNRLNSARVVLFVICMIASSITLPVTALAVKANPKPGRSKIPLAQTSGHSQVSVKMRPSKARLAKSLPAKTSGESRVQSRLPANNEPLAALSRSIRIGWASPTPSLGTTFALAVDGEYLVTSADSVSEAWTNSGDVKFFVQDSSQPVTLVGLDLASNIAVFSAGSNARLPKSLPRQRLRYEPAKGGEEFLALTPSGLSAGAKRIGVNADFGVTRERYELATADIRGTAFIFDRSGRWVATLSPADHRQGRVFDATAASSVQDMLRRIESRPLAPITGTVLQAQAFAWQEKWAASYLETTTKGSSLRYLSCEAEAMKVSESKFAAQLNRTRLVRCSNNVPVSLSSDYALGIELVTGEVNLNEDIKSLVANDTSAIGSFADSFFSHVRTPASVNQLTIAECEKTDVTNSKQRKVHVRFCTSALKNSQGLSDTTITVLSADTGQRASVSALHLKGFDVKNSKKFMQWLIDAEAIR